MRSGVWIALTFDSNSSECLKNNLNFRVAMTKVL